MSEPPTIANESVELTSATKMPILGLGTWQLRGSTAVNAMLRALEVGYRHIDTATAYGNEEQGETLAQSGIRREDIFATTKLSPSRAGRERETLEPSLDALEKAFWFDISVRHAGPDATATTLRVQVTGQPSSLSVKDSRCALQTSALTCAFPAFAPGSTLVRLSGVAPTKGTLTATAVVDGVANDSNRANDTESASIQVR